MAKKHMDDGKKASSQKSDQPLDIDFGFGTLKLGGLFKGLGDLIDLASKAAEKGEALGKQGEFASTTKGGKEFRGMYGFSVRTLAGGKPVVETFGNVVKKTPKGPVVEKAREPYVDVFHEGNQIKVIAELPGVTESEIKTEIKGDILTISTTGKKEYTKELLLPAKVKETPLKSNYHNGILEIELEKA